MITWLKDFFYKTTVERRGYLVLLVVFGIGLTVPFTYPYFIMPEKLINWAEVKRNDSTFQKMMRRDSLQEEGEKEHHIALPFPFNPNTASREELAQLGLKPKVANTIINFREKGGKFYKPEDLKKIWGLNPSDYERLKDYVTIEQKTHYRPDFEKKSFEKNAPIPVVLAPFNPNTAGIDDFLRLGIPKKVAFMLTNYRNKGGFFKKKEDLKRVYGMDTLYARLEPFIVIEPLPQTTQPNPTTPIAAANPTAATQSNVPANIPNTYNNFPQKTFAKAPSSPIDINKATEEDWKKLPGIGQGYAKKILGFRDKLGGFTKVEQVKETFGLPDSTFQKAKPFLTISPIFRKININKVTGDELKAHPYIKWQQVNILTNYKAQHNDRIANWDEFKKIQGLTPDFVEKISPYLEF